jgi:hypothetical protein
MPSDLIWTLTGVILTLLVFSYLLGDQVLFRLAVYIFIGVTSAYGVVLILYQVLLPRLIWPLFSGSDTEKALTIVAILLTLLLLTRLYPRVVRLSSIPMGFLTGMGAAMAVGGAVTGTIVTQVRAAIVPDGTDMIAGSGLTLPGGAALGAFLLLGTICTLAYFQFGVRNRPGQAPERGAVLNLLSKVGEGFIGLTLGAVFAGVYASTVTALFDRLEFLVTAIRELIH